MSNEDYLDGDYRILADQIRETYVFHGTPGVRIPTGWESIDPLMYGGLAPGEVFYILGRSHVGKSMFLLNIIANNREIPGVLFTIEMPQHQAITRLTSMVMRQDHDYMVRLLQHGQIAWEANPLMDYELWILDMAMTLERMGATVEKIKRDYDDELHPRYVALDYLELVRTEGRRDGYERAETLARDLKAWSKELGLPVFVVHQSNMTRKRNESVDENSARGAGYTEADLVLGVWQPDDLPVGKYKARVIKNRISGVLSEELTFQLNSSLTLDDPVTLDRMTLGLI